MIVAHAAGFEHDEDDEVVEAGFAEGVDGSGFALMFQRTDYEPDEQDIRLGMDTYCLTTGDGRTHYGGLLAAELDDGQLTLRLSPDAAGTIGIAEITTVRLDVDAASLSAFRDGLPLVVNWGRSHDIPTLRGFDCPGAG
ncbi:Imm10 family immunity protein [Micromonospora sp. A3M-1-15]|uniref:Imm10 family immunity protein n=1 Tax=Micromonospora sp. A3M-1-15 TaxID=2962035 RepID=UPI0020B73D8A|nr:Imm10 family immunity protein [Micromonospora sp. A3M-1-15]MCP3784119.1 Imm10 family immunity protein [Micromonospora sp. A3M-1-15]